MASDDILANHEPFLYNPKTCVEDNNLCFGLCLAHSDNASMSDHQKLVYTKQLHSTVELDHMQRVSFIDVTKFFIHLISSLLSFNTVLI